MQNELKRQLFSRTGLFKLRVLTPIGEEILFRGLLMPAVQQSLDNLGVPQSYQAVGSSAINSVIFGVAHGKGRRIYATAAGLLYSGMTHYFGGHLWAATVGHMTANIIASVHLRETIISLRKRR